MNLLSGGRLFQLADRLAVVQWLRLFLAAAVLAIGFVEPNAGEVFPLVGAYLALTAVVEVVRRRAPGATERVMAWMLLLDGLFLALALAFTGGADSPVRVLVFFHVTAVTLIVSYRTGLKLAVWYALLLFLGHAAASADLLGNNTTGTYRDALLTSIGLLLFAAGAAVFSSVNERALRRSQAELHALVELGLELEHVRGAADVAVVLARHAQVGLGFPRAVVLIRGGEQWVRAAASSGREAHVVGSAGIDVLPDEVWDAEAPTLVRGVDDAALDELLPDGRNVVVVPIVADGEALGIMLAEGRRAQIPAVTVETLAQSASQAAAALRNSALLSEVEHLATRDGLTGVANRRLFEETLEREVARSHRRTSPLALVVLDVDHFKHVNDTVGHQAGDAVLREVAAAMVGNTKSSDLPARYGGDEFVVLLPDCTRADAIRVAERLRAAIAAEVTAVPVTVSAGVGAIPENAGNGERLVAAADAALYAAKRDGRDRSVGSTRAAQPGEAPAHPALPRPGRARHGA